MNLPDPQISRAALLAGSAFGLGYLIRQGLDHSSEMSRKEKLRIGKGLLLVAAGSLAYHLISEKAIPWDF